MFRIEDAKGRTIRSAVSNAIVTVINPSRKVKVIPSGHIDSVTTGHAINSAANAQAAAASAQAAEQSEIAAAASQGQAATSASSAVGSANAAAASMQNAQSIQNEAKSLKSVVDAAVLDATTKAGNANSSANAASQSAADALAAKNDAETAQTNAETAETNAETAETNAETAQTNAESARDDAKKIADNPKDTPYTLSDLTTTGLSARHYAETASDTITSAQSTLNSTLASAQQAAATAAQAQIDAQNTILSIAGSHTDFHERYLGDFTSDPTSGVNGATLEAGDLYYNTTDQLMRIYTATSGWIDQVTPAAPTVKRNYIFEVGSSLSHTFSGQDLIGNTLSFTEDNLDVFLNGAKLRDDEFTANAATNTVVINGDVALSSDDNVGIVAFEAFALADIVTRSGGGTFAGAVTFTLETAFNDGLDVTGDVEIDGHTEISSTGAPLVLDAEHTSININQNHKVLGIHENGSLRGGLGFRNHRIYIDSEYNNVVGSGLEFGDTAILPRSEASPTNDAIDLGETSHRFNNIHTANLHVNGRDTVAQAPSPVAGDLLIETIDGVAHYSMKNLVGGSGISLDRPEGINEVRISANPFRLLAMGFYRPKPISTGDDPHRLPANHWHAAPINDWVYQSAEYLERTGTASNGVFAVPSDTKMLIEYGASMGCHFSHDDENIEGSRGPVVRSGPLKLRLGSPSLLLLNGYSVDEANGYMTNGEIQQLYGSYLTPAEYGYTEFRIEAQWPQDVEGSWSRETTAYTDANGVAHGPNVAWVRIWDTATT